MKQKVWIALLVLFPLLALGGLYYVLELKNQHPSHIINHEKTPLEFKDNHVQCPQCAMYLVGKKHTVQIVDEKKKTHFFDDIGCAILWLRDQKIEPKNVTFWAYSLDTKRYIDGFKAYYSLSEQTPMVYGFGAYENAMKGSVSFDEMRLKMLRGENMTDPKVRQKLLGQQP